MRLDVSMNIFLRYNKPTKQCDNVVKKRKQRSTPRDIFVKKTKTKQNMSAIDVDAACGLTRER